MVSHTEQLECSEQVTQQNLQNNLIWRTAIFPAILLAVIYKYQPSTTMDENLQAHTEARDIQEPDSKDEDEDEKFEEPESAGDGDAQEDDENDDFDENADWSEDDEEEGKEYDIVRRYNSVWSECWKAEPKAYEGHLMTIYGSADQSDEVEPFRCTANFTWGNFVAQFTCTYRPETRTFTNFKAKRKTLDGGMEEVKGVTVRMWEQGESASDRKKVKDDRDNPFLFVQMDFGNDREDDVMFYVYGKKVVEDASEDNTVLTEGEKGRLRLPRSEYRDK